MTGWGARNAGAHPLAPHAAAQPSVSPAPSVRASARGHVVHMHRGSTCDLSTRLWLQSRLQYGAVGGRTLSTCDGPCAPGRWGTTAQTASTCTGACASGYACPAGSTNATAAICPAGTYSTGGAGACTNCPDGVFGNTTGLTTANCSGLCPAGYVVHAVTVCPCVTRLAWAGLADV